MKYLKQFMIILIFTFLGELCHTLIPLPVPASIYGLVLLLIALLTKFIDLSQIYETAHFLVAIMPVMFIPAGVGLLESFGVLRPVWLPVAIITVVSTVVVMGLTGRFTQFFLKKERDRIGVVTDAFEEGED